MTGQISGTVSRQKRCTDVPPLLPLADDLKPARKTGPARIFTGQVQSFFMPDFPVRSEPLTNLLNDFFCEKDLSCSEQILQLSGNRYPGIFHIGKICLLYGWCHGGCATGQYNCLVSFLQSIDGTGTHTVWRLGTGNQQRLDSGFAGQIECFLQSRDCLSGHGHAKRRVRFNKYGGIPPPLSKAKAGEG